MEPKFGLAGWWQSLFGPSRKELIEALRAANTRAAHHCASVNELAAKLRRRNVSWPRPATRIPEHVVLKEFNVRLDQGLMAALHQELDDKIQALVDIVSQQPSATLTEESRLHTAGGLEHLREFQKELLDLSAKASTADADEKDEKPE